MRAEAEVWWRQAEADFATALLLRVSQQHYAASWFAQQAAEKALKTVYLDQQGRIAPKTHDIEFLGAEVGVPDEIEQELVRLNPAFDAARYPDPLGATAPVDRVSEGMAAEHVDAAKAVVEWARMQLN